MRGAGLRLSVRLLLILLAASPAFAQNKAVQQSKGAYSSDYQEQLLKRPLSASDKAYCDGKKAYTACHVTRNYLADIHNKSEQGFPALADAEFARTEAEEKLLLDRIP